MGQIPANGYTVTDCEFQSSTVDEVGGSDIGISIGVIAVQPSRQKDRPATSYRKLRLIHPVLVGWSTFVGSVPSVYEEN